MSIRSTGLTAWCEIAGGRTLTRDTHDEPLSELLERDRRKALLESRHDHH